MKYLLVGSGRLSTHFNHYLDLLGLPCLTWSRESASFEDLESLSSQCSHTLLAITDQAIEPFVSENPALLKTTLIHFSGRLETPLAHRVHPLMTFGHDLFEDEFYPAIPFITFKEEPAFSELLPGFPNPSYVAAQGPLADRYHAYCVLGGNFSTLLWQYFLQGMTQEVGLPEEALWPYIEQSHRNLRRDWPGALTGPLTRGDTKTIEANLEVFRDSPLGELYDAFVKTYELQKVRRSQ